MRSVSLCTRFSIRSQMRDGAPGYLCPQKPVNFHNLRQPRQAAQSCSFPAKHRRLRPVSRPFARVFLQRLLQDCGKVHVCVLCFIVQQRRDRQCFLIPAKSRWSIRHSKVGLRPRAPFYFIRVTIFVGSHPQDSRPLLLKHVRFTTVFSP